MWCAVVVFRSCVCRGLLLRVQRTEKHTHTHTLVAVSPLLTGDLIGCGACDLPGYFRVYVCVSGVRRRECVRE